MALEFKVSTVIAASPDELYAAWLDSESHTNMTGGQARVNDEVGATFEAWDGYIHGRNLVLEPGKRIVQSWRTSEFDDSEADSQIEVRFEQVSEGTKVTIWHTGLPPHGAQYEQGWVESYFEPMKEYFEG
jgi:activator of HSP90 ATPase